jgi:eukaryotic-like serine/threonine-protein kinase
MRAVLEIRTRTLGPDHFDTLMNRHNLALILHDRGKLGEAERENRVVLQARTRLLGPDHPRTLLTRSNLAEVLIELGELDEAETENTAVLETATRLFGLEHRETLASRHYRALILRHAIIGPRAIVTRIRQVVDWATRVPQE